MFQTFLKAIEKQNKQIVIILRRLLLEFFIRIFLLVFINVDFLELFKNAKQNTVSVFSPIYY